MVGLAAGRDCGWRLSAGLVFGTGNCRGFLFNLVSRERERADRRQSWCRQTGVSWLLTAWACTSVGRVELTGTRPRFCG